MKIFISWSGDPSRTVAEALRTWLPTVLAGSVECFVSSQDIRRGERGMDVIAGELHDRDYGIVILTRDNLTSPWVNFEAGALGKSLGVGKVAPLLMGITPADVEGPIAQFQSTLLTDKDDMRQFVRDLASVNPGVPEATIDTMFNVKWDELEMAVTGAGSRVSNPKTHRTAESMLEEILHHVRESSKIRRSATAKEEDALRLARLDHLEKLHGSRTYVSNGEFLEVADFDPSKNKVLIPMDEEHNVYVWRRLTEGDMAPF